MVGQGSVNHNSRAFNAKNTDRSRSHLNITYCHENIKTVFHELFDEALKRYNDKQTRADRKIEDYYEKIRSSKQEKPFHEIILQVGNKDDMSAEGEDGQLAAAVLDERFPGAQPPAPGVLRPPPHGRGHTPSAHRLRTVHHREQARPGHKGIAETGVSGPGIQGRHQGRHGVEPVGTL